jgi:hypothetical protein
MFYEWNIAWKTIRKEGLGSLFQQAPHLFWGSGIGGEFSYDPTTGGKIGRGHPILRETGRGLICPGQFKSWLAGLLIGWASVRHHMPFWKSARRAVARYFARKH